MPIDVLARDLYDDQDFLPKHLTQLEVAIPPTNVSIGVKLDRSNFLF